MVVTVIAAGRWLDPAKPLWSVALLGWLLPFVVWNWLMGIIIYVHHTHPAVPWFNDRTKWKVAQVQLFGTVHVRLPQPLHMLSNNIMEHNAHHLDPSVPFYHLATMQEQVRRLTDGIVFFKLGIWSYLGVVKQCKLFDFERGCWVQFDGYRSPALAVCPSENSRTST
jgi:omega-6 fatty acid desaturase (delta-12 desaturase)